MDVDDPSREHGAAPYLYRPSSGFVHDNGEAFNMSSHANSGYNYIPDFPNSQYGPPQRLPALPHHDEQISQNQLTPLRIPSLAETVSNAQGMPYSASRHGHSASQGSMTSPVQPAHSPQAYWDAHSRQPGRSDPSRSTTSSWPVLPALDMSMSTQRSAPSSQMSSRTEAFSPQVPPHRPWSSSASSATSSSSGGASGSHYANSQFPTLTSPFYPAQSPSQRTAEAVSPSPSSHPSSSPEYFSRSSYAPAGGVPPPTGSAYTLHNASQWPQQYPRAGHEERGPALQPISTYSLSASSVSPPPTSSGAQPSQMAYWERTRYEGR